MLQAFGNAPCARSGTPTAQRLAEIRGERPCIAFGGIESRVERVDIRPIIDLHDSIPYGMEIGVVNTQGMESNWTGWRAKERA